MNPQIIDQAAQVANQVGLLTWLVAAITLFCGSLVFVVIYQNGKREERYATLVENHIQGLSERINSYKEIIKERMVGIEEANRANKVEHAMMTAALKDVSETLTNLVFTCKATH